MSPDSGVQRRVPIERINHRAFRIDVMEGAICSVMATYPGECTIVRVIEQEHL